MIRTYARIASIVLLALAVIGFWLLEWRPGTAIYHAGLGLLFAYAGFLQKDPVAVRGMVGGLGVLVLGIKAVQVLMAWPVPATPLHLGPIELTCIVVGIASLLAARYLPDRTPGPESR